MTLSVCEPQCSLYPEFLNEWAQCNSCMTTQTPSFLTVLLSWLFPPINVSTSLWSLVYVHVWLHSMHGSSHKCQEHTVLFVSLSKMGLIVFQLFWDSLQFGILTVFWIGIKSTPFLKTTLLKAAPLDFVSPLCPFCPSECITKQTCNPQGRNCRYACCLGGSPAVPCCVGPQPAFALKASHYFLSIMSSL